MEIKLIIDGTEYELHPKASPKQPDYQILDFLLIEHNEIINMRSFGACHVNYYLDKPNEYSIYSIKRLSDGEVFTVGDKLDDFLDGSSNTILFFMLDYKGNDVWLCTDMYNQYGCSLEVAKKIPVIKPLFTTVDGMEIFDGDSWISVDKNFAKWICTTKTQYEPNFEGKRFSSHTAADRYILQNKPIQVSYKELVEYLENEGGCFEPPIRKFFQSKIKPCQQRSYYLKYQDTT